ncbi:MAG: MarR family transcriptional regulator [Pseudomonadota bacterium]
MTDRSDIKLIDHIGVDLWAAADAWKAHYTSAMVRAGYAHFATSGAAILQFIGPRGARPADLARQLGISRQAVQQLIDTLEIDGVVTRAPDPADGRGKIIRLTDKGTKAHWRGNIVKAKIESELTEAIGPEGLQRLKDDLARITAILAGTHDPQ